MIKPFQYQYQGQRQQLLDKQSAKEGGGDIGGILGLLAAGIGAAAIIGTAGIAAAPIAAIGSIAGAASLGSGIGKAVGAEVGNKVGEVQAQDQAAAMRRKIGMGQQQQKSSVKSQDTKMLEDAAKVIGRLEPTYNKKYGRQLLEGLSISYINDMRNEVM